MRPTLFRKTLVLTITILLSILVLTPNIYGVTKINNIENITINVTTNENKIDINYKINNFIETPIEINGINYMRISIDGESNILTSSAPDIPNICRSIIIPDTAEMDVTVISSTYEEYSNVLIAPSKGNLLRTVNPDDIPFEFGNVYNIDNFYPSKIAELDEPYILRDFRGQVVKIYPIQYNPVTKIMRFYTDITVEVFSIGTDTRNIINREELPVKVETNFNQLYKNHFINYGLLDRYTPVEEQGNMLIITYDAFWDSMIPFYEWKILKGVPTEMVNVSTIGAANAIKTYIEQYYYDNNLTFVLLVGDINQIPSLTVSYFSSDPSYSYILGNDHYPDLFVGRFSAENTDQVATQVLRSIEYERDPQLNAEWYHKGTGVASNLGPGDDGEYDNEHIDNIRDDLLAYTYTLVDQIYDPTGTAAMVSSALNEGRGIVNYCGHGSMTSWGSTGFSNTHVNALVNDNMLPYVVSVACYNGQFDGGTCFAEAWMRATNNNNGEPTGSVANFMSSKSQAWDPPMDAQDEIIDILVESYANNKKTTIGALSFNGCMHMNDEYGSDGYIETDAWTVFGDPSLQIRTDTPEEMTVNHDEIISIGAETFELEVVGVENALCAITNGNELLGYGYSDEDDIAVINFFEPIEFTEEAILVVTAYNKIPYITPIQVGNSYPPTIPVINGPTVGRINKEYEFTALSDDPEGDQIYYMFDWGDETQSEWVGPVDSGNQVTITHTWTNIGSYSIKAKAMDVEQSRSRWTEPYSVIMDVPILKLKSIKGGLFSVKTTIKNEGIAEADNIDWEINIEGSIFFGRNSTGNIDTIAPGDTVTISTGTVFGFGNIRAHFILNGPECNLNQNRGGKLFLFYVKINPGGE